MEIIWSAILVIGRYDKYIGREYEYGFFGSRFKRRTLKSVRKNAYQLCRSYIQAVIYNMISINILVVMIILQVRSGWEAMYHSERRILHPGTGLCCSGLPYIGDNKFSCCYSLQFILVLLVILVNIEFSCSYSCLILVTKNIFVKSPILIYW